MVALQFTSKGLSRSIADMKIAFTHLARLLSKKSVRVVFRGTECHTDGSQVTLPELTLLERKTMSEEEVKEAQAFLNTVRGYLFHELGHVLFTDFAWFEKAFKEGKIVKMFLNCCEDIRIEQRFAAEWRGATSALKDLHEWTYPSVQENIHDIYAKGFRVVAVMSAFTWSTRSGSDHDFSRGLPDEVKEILRHLEIDRKRMLTLKSTEDAYEFGKYLLEKIRKLISKEDEKQKRMKSKNGGDEEDDEESSEDGSEGDEEKEDLDTLFTDAVIDSGGQLERYMQEAASKLTSNDIQYRAYTTEYDTEVEARSFPLENFSTYVAEVRSQYGVMRRNLANQLRSKANGFTIYEQEEGDLDHGMAYRLASKMSDRVFKEEHMSLDLTNIGVIILINQSGSMADVVDGFKADEKLRHIIQRSQPFNATHPVPLARLMASRMELARQSTVLLSEVLSSLNIDFGVYGHTTSLYDEADRAYARCPDVEKKLYTRWGGSRLVRYKGLSEKYGSVKSRLLSLYPLYNTHDGEVLQNIGQMLLSETKLTRRIIFTIDDGAPIPVFPSTVKNAQEMLASHVVKAKQAASDLEAAGVEVVGLGMGTDSVKHFYKKSVYVKDIATFPLVAMATLRAVLSQSSK